MESSPEAGRSGNEEDAPKAVYTTAGTLYNPKTTQPMQAPNRRGRTKWNLPGVPSSELSLLPKSALATLQMRGLLRTDNGPVPEYSPLQQNTDRAVSPSRRRELPEDLGLKIAASPAERRAERVSRPFTFVKPIIFDGSNKRMSAPKPATVTAPVPASAPASTMGNTTTTATVAATTTVQPPEDDEGSDGIEVSDSDLDNRLRGLSVKSLHNLASYSNPVQKQAQRALMGGRPISTGGASMPAADGQTTSRPMTPGMTGPAPGFPVSENTPRGPAEPKPSAYYTQISRYNSADALYRTSGGGQEHGGGYKTTLAKGPGAPEPLTAGPPGLRQHKASRIEQSIQDSSRSQMSVSVSEESVGMPGYDGPMAVPRQAARSDDQVARGKERETAPRSYPLVLGPKVVFPYVAEPVFNETSELLLELRHGSIPDPRPRVDPRATNSGHPGQIPIFDTKLPRDVSKFYSMGQPPMMVVGDNDPDWMQRDHAEARPAWIPGTYMRNAAESDRRDQRSLRQFYAGYTQIGGDMDHIIKEAERRRNPGVIGDGRPEPTPALPTKMTVEQVNAMPKSEAVKPILNMAFSTLVRHIEEAESQEMARKRQQAQAEAKANAQARNHASSGAASGQGALGKSSMA